ncbi:nucleotidyltransferase family protein [Sphingobacterium humi]|uniref:Nucleotidyltransferase family protein n=1 Tax=Sphingobacterium humi TaxID=1796905 RepID=A0A6N8KU67_9SPHI|nr:nucleotidyltransferase family protein [Sphingobacterium humi]MVZ60975.1 hypothetical protein [Sphingobacterium humi]
MNEQKIKQVFFTLLQSGLWNKPVQHLENFPLSESDWELVYLWAVHQTVEGVLFDGIQQLPQNLQPQKSILLKWIVRVEKLAMRNNWMNQILVDQIHFFSQIQVSPILLKGQGLAQYYEEPSRRVSGDIDWYFENRKDYSKVAAALHSKDITVQEDAGYSLSYVWNNCEIEHHQRMFDLHNPFLKGFLGKLAKKEEPKRLTLEVNEKTITLPSALETLVQVNAHILKHLLSFGIGLRQLCDAARAYFSLKNQYDERELQQVYKRAGLHKWIDLLHHILVKNLGLAESYLPFALNKNNNAEWMLEDILLAGNFGFHHEAYKSEELRAGKRQQIGKRLFSSFIKYVPVAPKEAISFPIVHFLSRFSH